ncbi:MAG: alpha-L-fucosidase [Alistipes sp.]|nr:alpha-L-fucosidase [Alistipes sp.]
MNDSWGFRITDENYKSVRELIHLLVRTAGTGANLLLNGRADAGRPDTVGVRRQARGNRQMDGPLR